MGLFDGIEAGWNSFVNNEGKKILNTITKPNPLIQIATGNADNILSDKSAKEQWQDVKDSDVVQTAIKPNPLIAAATGNAGNILSDKPVTQQWDEIINSDLVKDPVNTVTNTVTNATKEVSNTVEKYVIEPAQNVVKGVGEALPIIAIGGAAVLVLSALLSRR